MNQKDRSELKKAGIPEPRPFGLSIETWKGDLDITGYHCRLLGGGRPKGRKISRLRAAQIFWAYCIPDGLKGLFPLPKGGRA
jgi:hypothetical protein